MRSTADRDGNTRYFSAKLGWKEHFDPREIEMLYRGAVPMLIPPTTVQGRRNNVIRFDITPYATLEFYLSFALSREQFGKLLLACIDTFQQLRQLYMNDKNLVLELDKVYVLLHDGSVHFIYLPLMDSTREGALVGFFHRMLSSVERSTYELGEFVEACAAWLDRPVGFTLEEFAAFIRSNLYQAKRVRPDDAREEQAAARYYHPARSEQRGEKIGPAEPSSSTSQGQTVLLDSRIGATALLDGPSEEERFSLLREGTGERIALSHFPFLIGTELGSVSYCVSDNPAVSRRHAVFDLTDGQCTVTDQGSTNKTYVNGCALSPRTPQPLKDGDHLRLANEMFTFVQEDI